MPTLARLDTWLLGSQARGPHEQLSRARTVAWFTFVIIWPSLGWAAVAYFVYRWSAVAAICLCSCLGFWGLLTWLRRGGSVRTASILVMAVSVTVLLSSTHLTSGVAAMSSPWPAVMVLLATYLLGRGWGIGTALTLSIAQLMLAFLESKALFLPGDARFLAFAQLQVGPNVLALWVVTVLGIVYRQTLDRQLDERLRVERELKAAQRLESMGRLVAGMAHEVNNPLSFVVTNIGFVHSTLRQAASPQEQAECVDALSEALEGADRIRRIVADLKAFSRETDDVAEWVSVNQAVEFTLKLTSSLVKHCAKVAVAVPAGLEIQVPSGRLGQVLLNLVSNAAQAIDPGHTAANEISIEARLDGEGCVLEVRDTGSGISPEHLEHVFEPFFTTRPLGGGTGLGLAVSRGIVERLGGSLSVTSERGKGSCFRMRLPRARLGNPDPHSAPTPWQDLAPRAGRVLVVDDEVGITSAVRRALRPLEVIAETSGIAALARCRAEHFDLVLCDLMMPECGGDDFFTALGRIWSDAAERVVFITGGGLTQKSHAFIEQHRTLLKPLDENALRIFVADHLDRTHRRRT